MREITYVEGLQVHLYRSGIAVLMDSAPNSDSIVPSHVIHTMKISKEIKKYGMIITFEHFSIEKKVDSFLHVLPDYIRFSQIPV